MAKLTIEQTHRMSAEDARKCIEALNKSLADKYDLKSSWLSDTEAKVERPGATGTIRIERDRVLVSLDLSFALSLMKGQIETRIREELQRLFSGTPAV